MVEGDATSDVSRLREVRHVFRLGEALDLAALRVRSDTRLARGAPLQREGEVCIAPEECGPGTYCGYDATCAATCSVSEPCPVGEACFPQAQSASLGFCYPGDGCDPIEQACDNGAACIWLGNGATLCWVAGFGTQGAPCDPGGLCAPGYQCDFASGKCHELCDPAAAPSTCPSGTNCLDLSATAGVPIGECRP